MKIAVIVNDMGAINLDAEEVKTHKLVQEKRDMVELHNGCICCTLRGDLLRTVKELSESDYKFDYLVIESTGIAEPLPVAQTFTMDVNGDGTTGEVEHKMGDGHEHKEEDFKPLSNYARLDTLVTVVDSFNFLPVLSSVETEADRKAFLGDEDGANEEELEATLSRLLLDQIEFADVLLLNKIDLLPESDREATVKKLQTLVKKLNPEARVIVPTTPKFEDFDVTHVMNTNLFDMDKAMASAGWIQELNKPEHNPETEEYGISSIVFRENGRPFHPVRLEQCLNGFGKLEEAKADMPFAGVVRAKGRVWLANADAIPIMVHVAGRQLDMTPNIQGPFLAKIPRDRWSEDELDEFAMGQEGPPAKRWTEAFGDRHSELICIGVHLDKEAIVKALQAALLTDEELGGGLEKWILYPDPFFGGMCAKNFCELEFDDEDEGDEGDEGDDAEEVAGDLD